MKRPEKRAKLSIETIVLCRSMDENPDTSYLGEYLNRPQGEQCIDRENIREIDDKGRYVDHQLLDEMFQRAKDGSKSALKEIAELAGEVDTIDYDIEEGINDDLREVLHSAVEDGHITLGETRNDRGRHQCRYFSPTNVDESLPVETQRLNARQDYERMESLDRGMWYYICIRAVAYISVNGVSQVIRSGGLYGVESDSEEDELLSIESDELADLTEQLATLGFSRRKIAAAVRDVSRESA